MLNIGVVCRTVTVRLLVSTGLVITSYMIFRAILSHALLPSKLSGDLGLDQLDLNKDTSPLPVN